VFCQLEVLRHSFPSSVRHILDELPESLDETYERILREIRKPKQGHAHRLLQCLVAAVRPLRVEELAEVLAFDFDTEGIPKLNLGWRWENQEEAVMSACSSLVIIVKDKDSRIVQFSHYSVKEFLIANRLAEPIRDVSRYHIRIEAAHTILAQTCLGVLLRLVDRVDRDNIKNFPLVRYAARYWPTHARFENTLSCIEDGMERLFDGDKSHFATWLWIFDEDWGGRSMSSSCPEKPEAFPLYYAARLGFRGLAEHLISKHPEHVNTRGGGELTPMHIAAFEGHADILSLLLEHGADTDGRGIYESTPLYRAAEKGKLEAGQYLLDRGADINAGSVTDQTPLFRAVFYCHVEFARMLLERGASVGIPDDSGRTPLHWAVAKGNILAMQLLLEYGADVNTRDKDGKTPSEFGPGSGKHEVVKLLSEYGTKSVK
jgi:Ankyrin repeats (3 copies)/Ankyrin repeats (many copies)